MTWRIDPTGGVSGWIPSRVEAVPGFATAITDVFGYAPIPGQGISGILQRPNNLGGGIMASLFTGGAGVTGGGADWGSLLGSVGSAITGIYQTKAQTKQLKALNRLLSGGSRSLTPSTSAMVPSMFAPVATVPAATGTGALGGLLGGLLGGGLAGSLLPDINLPGGLEEGGTGMFGPDLFAPTNAGARQRMIDAPHPTTGERVYWRPVGRPLMFSGDAALLKRTRKLARKLDAGCGSARATFRRRRRR